MSDERIFIDPDPGHFPCFIPDEQPRCDAPVWPYVALLASASCLLGTALGAALGWVLRGLLR